MGRLSDKVAVVTGGAGGIGRSAAQTFVQEGARVLLVDIDSEALEEAVRTIRTDTVSSVVADVTDPESVRHYVGVAVERYGGIDVFINNAGIEGVVETISEYPIETFDQVMAVNVRGVWLGLKYVIPVMEKRGGGSIVITSSTAGVQGSLSMSAYVTSKHAVIGMMRSAARECAAQGIRVNTVNPAPTETRMMRSIEEQIDPADPEPVKKRLTGKIPLGRYAEPEDIAKVMLFLASDESAFCTGSVYMVDGGWSA